MIYRWVSTDYVDIFAHDGSEHMEAFNKLFQFISGKNSDSVEIPMTAPVTFRSCLKHKSWSIVQSLPYSFAKNNKLMVKSAESSPARVQIAAAVSQCLSSSLLSCRWSTKHHSNIWKELDTLSRNTSKYLSNLNKGRSKPLCGLVSIRFFANQAEGPGPTI